MTKLDWRRARRFTPAYEPRLSGREISAATEEWAAEHRRKRRKHKARKLPAPQRYDDADWWQRSAAYRQQTLATLAKADSDPEVIAMIEADVIAAGFWIGAVADEVERRLAGMYATRRLLLDFDQRANR